MLRCLCHCNKRRFYFSTAPKYLHWHIPLLWRGGRRSLTGWLWWFCTRQLPSTVHDGTFSTASKYLHWHIPLLWRGGRRSLTGWLWWFCTRQLPSTVHDGTFSTAPHWAVVLPTHHLGQALACPTYIPMIGFCKMLRCLCHCNKRRFYFSTASSNTISREVK